MDAGDWAALAATAVMLIGQLAAVVLMLGNLNAKVNNNAREIEQLERTKASEEGARSRQAQLEEMKRHIAECDGKLTELRSDIDKRFERSGTRIADHEHSQNQQNMALASALAKIDAGMSAMQASIERLFEMERARAMAAPAQPNLIEQLQQFAALQKMLKGVP